jgi:hypothetical protein
MVGQVPTKVGVLSVEALLSPHGGHGGHCLLFALWTTVAGTQDRHGRGWNDPEVAAGAVTA